MAYDFYIGQFLNGIGIEHALDDGIEPLAHFATGQQARTVAAFSVGGHQRHGGQRWKSLAPSTIRRKGHAKILIEKGVLRASFFFKVISAVPGRSIIDLGTNVKYAKFHQIGAKHLPIRKVVDVTKQDAKILAETVEVWAEKELNGRFRHRLYLGAA